MNVSANYVRTVWYSRKHFTTNVAKGIRDKFRQQVKNLIYLSG
jgi:hypothetical protein